MKTEHQRISGWRLAAWSMALLFASNAAFAALDSQSSFEPDEYSDSSKFYLGGSFGAGLIADDGGTHLGYGLATGYRFHPYWSAGAFYNRVGRGSINPGEFGATTGGVDANISFFGVEAAYFVPFAPGFQLGPKAALGRNSITLNDVESTKQNLYVGPKFAYDYALGGAVSVGGEASMLFGTGTDTSTLTSLLGTLKIWL